MNTRLFLNDYYRLLELLYDNQTVVLHKTVIPLTQADIAEALGISKAKINVLIGKLKEEGYLEKSQKGKYRLLDKSLVMIEEMTKLEDELEKLE